MDSLAFQEIINKIDGVISAKIICENGNVTELHILANNLRAAKQIVRDIESSLLAAFDYRIDRRVISIAQINTDECKTIKRIQFEGVTLATYGNQVDCTVQLLMNDEEYSCRQTAVKTEANRRKIIASSTIKAVEHLLGKDVSFDVQDVIVQSSRDLSFATVIINMLGKERDETMIGSALVKNDVSEAIAKACLDAINRRIEKYNN
jgi:hypothetical protein